MAMLRKSLHQNNFKCDLTAQGRSTSKLGHSVWLRVIHPQRSDGHAANPARARSPISPCPLGITFIAPSLIPKTLMPEGV